MIDPPPARKGSPLAVGSEEHRRLLSRFFLDTFEEFEPENIRWPELEGDSRERLTRLPFWEEAVRIETSTSRIVQEAVSLEKDPAVREAIALQGYEEGRHARLLDELTRFYGIQLPRMRPRLSGDRELDFLRAGYAEVFDSFFAFGLFEVARRSKLFADGLLEVFDRVMQEEARHVLFFVNWVRCHRARLPRWRRPLFTLRCAGAVLRNVATRVQTARRMNGKIDDHRNFTLSGTQEITGKRMNLRSLLATCLAENDRRMGAYDARLLRPVLVPRLVRFTLRLLPA